MWGGILKFKIVEDFDRGLKTQLSVDTLNETQSKYRLGPLLGSLLKSFMKDTNLSKSSQKALKIYLCTNRGVPFSDDLDVHHIDGDHSNYQDNNIALLKHQDHINLHNECRDVVLTELRKEVDIGGPGNITSDDLSTDIDKIIKSRYVDLLQSKVSNYRVDKLRR